MNRLLRNGLLLISITVAGCNGHQASESASRPFAGQRLAVVIPEGSGFEQTLRPVLDEWAAQTGASSTVVSYSGLKPARNPSRSVPRPSFGQVIGQQPAEEAAVVIVPLTGLSELAAGGSLLPIPESRQTAEHLNWRDVLSGLREHAVSFKGHPMVVPLSCPVLVCYYRADLLKKAGLSPPRTWDEYQHLVETLNQWAPGLTAVEPWNKNWRATMFLARAVSYATHPGNYSLFFDITSGQPLIGTPGFVRALKETRHALTRMPPKVKTYTPMHCRQEFLAGRAAMAVTVEPSDVYLVGGESARPLAVNMPRSTGIEVTVAPLPGRRTVFNRSSGKWEQPRDRKRNRPTLVFGGLAAGVVGSGDTTPAAWNLLETLTGDQRSTAFGSSGSSLCRESQTTVVSPQTAASLKGRERQMAVSVIAESLRDPRLIVELPMVGREQFRAALTEGLNGVLDGSADAAASLAAVAAKWQIISKEIGGDRVIDSYRGALGLSPRHKPRLP